MKLTKILMFVFVIATIILISCEEDVPVGIWNGDRKNYVQYVYDLENDSLILVNDNQDFRVISFLGTEDQFLMEGIDQYINNLYFYSLEDKAISLIAENVNFYASSQQNTTDGYPNKIIYTENIPYKEIGGFFIYDVHDKNYRYYEYDTTEAGYFSDYFLTDDNKYVINKSVIYLEGQSSHRINVFSLNEYKNEELNADTTIVTLVGISSDYSKIFLRTNPISTLNNQAEFYYYDIENDSYVVIDTSNHDEFTIINNKLSSLIYLMRGSDTGSIHLKEFVYESYTSETLLIYDFYAYGSSLSDDKSKLTRAVESYKNSIEIFDVYSGELVSSINIKDLLIESQKVNPSPYVVGDEWNVYPQELSFNNKYLLVNVTFNYYVQP